MSRKRQAEDETLLLIHGGLAEPVDAARFWYLPGVAGALEARGCQVIAPDRETAPESWAAAAAEMDRLVDRAVAVVAGSNGVSVALRMAIDHPNAVERLVLLWPATAGDPRADSLVAPAGRHLLAGETIRGVTDAELESIEIRTTVVPAEPENLFHRHRTAARLAELLPAVNVVRPGTPESPRPEFGGHLERLVGIIAPDGEAP